MEPRRVDDSPATPEEARLREIAELRLTAPDASEALQSFAERAAQRLGAEAGMVTIVLDQAQYFAASHGLTGWMAEARGTPIEWSFCQHAVRSRAPFVVEDAEQHSLVRDYPIVAEDGTRSYAGIPLVTSRGHAVGTVCVLGMRPRRFSAEDIATLSELAREAVEAIERRRQ